MNTYMSGSLVRTTATFVNASGSATDPTTTTLKYKVGAGTVTTISSPVHDGTGVFHYDLDTSGWAGPDNQIWITEWVGQGTVQAISVDIWEVSPPAL